jgi:uncharacterized membrane protein (UPF0127 family)
MPRSVLLAALLLLDTAGAGLAGGARIVRAAQEVAETPDATPSPTSSADCPAPAADTRAFLDARGVTVNAPRGKLALVPVRTEATRERGLMCVVRIPGGKGMIFVFPPPEHVQNFWMKNTLVSLDMVFVTSAGTVTAVDADVPATPRGTPDDAVARRSAVGTYVIELGAGDAARHGIVRGTILTLPALTATE